MLVYNNPIKYTPINLETIIFLTGIGIEINKSLSFVLYKLEYVLNTLPNTPKKIAIPPMIVKYIQDMFASQNGLHIKDAGATKIIDTNTINKTNKEIFTADFLLERALPVT